MAKKKRSGRRQSGNPASRSFRREEHVRTRLARENDPRFVHTRREPNGRIQVEYDPGSFAGRQMQTGFDALVAQFRARFGRDPGPDDPLFFDPTSDEPRPMSAEQMADMVTEAQDAALEAGADPAFIHAWRVTGRMVTEMNRHNLTAHDMEEWDNAVEGFIEAHPDLYDENGVFVGRSRGSGGSTAGQHGLGDGLDPMMVAEVEHNMAGLMDLMRDLVERVVWNGDPVTEFNELLPPLHTLYTSPEVTRYAITVILATLTVNLVEEAENLDPEEVLDWARDHLHEDVLPAAEEISGVIGNPDAPKFTYADGSFHHLGVILIPAMIGLAAAVTATDFDGDTDWLRSPPAH